MRREVDLKDLKKIKTINLIRKYIGMRNIKTAFAVVISVLVSQAFKLDSPFFVATGALFSMETTVKKGINVGISRVLGTIMGGCLGIAMVMIDEGNLALLFIGIIFLISVLNALNWQECISMACVVFCVIMINMTSENIISYAVKRTIDTIVGIVIATVINYVISPPADSRFSKVE